MKEKKDSDRGLSPFSENGYKISLEIINHQNLPVNERASSTGHVSELSRKAFFSLFDLVAGECLKDNYIEDIEDNFGNIVDLLFKRFNLDQLDDKGSLGISLENFIKELEEYNFFVPESLITGGKRNLTPLEFNIGYKGDLNSVVETFKDILRALRDEKILFWKKVIEEYKSDKEGYDLAFRTKRTRQEKDLDMVSKIDIDDYIKRLSKK